MASRDRQYYERDNQQGISARTRDRQDYGGGGFDQADFDQDYAVNYGRERYYGAESSQRRARGPQRGPVVQHRDYGWQGSGRWDYGQGNYGYGNSRDAWAADDYDQTYMVDYNAADWVTPGPATGLGPRNYRRSDERIRDDVSERLFRHGQVDAGEIDVDVADGEVILQGTVNSRREKHLAEDAAESVPGARGVRNELRVKRAE